MLLLLSISQRVAKKVCQNNIRKENYFNVRFDEEMATSPIMLYFSQMSISKRGLTDELR